MASTITLGGALNWCYGYLVGRPTTGVGNIANEPGLTTANKVVQSILSAPFRWQWNRAETNFYATSAGVSDYAVSVPTFGWLEKAKWFCATNSTKPSDELQVSEVLTAETVPNQPRQIAPVLDNNAGSITFRLMPPPDTVYQVFITFQQAPVLLTSLSSTFAPIPDRYAFLYLQGLLGHLQGMYSPQLYAMQMEMFFRQLVGASEGLTEQQKAIYLEDSLRSVLYEQSQLLNVGQGRRSRSGG